MEAMVVTEVYRTAWNTVRLSEIYESPVVVCTVKYDIGTELLPAVVRVKNVGPTSFDIRLQNPEGDRYDEQFRHVHCLVVEEGSWKMPGIVSRTIEARTYLSTVTDYKSSWIGEQQTYLNSYDNPIVLGQVMSYNDDRWSVFWSRGAAHDDTPDELVLFTGKHIGSDSTVVPRDDETIGYIVIETGHDTSDGIEIVTARGGDTIRGYVDGSHEYTFAKAFATAPEVAVLSQVAMDGEDGSWALLGDITAAQLAVAVDEDQIDDDERTVSSEQLDYIVFSVAGVVELIAPTPSMESMVVTDVKMSNNNWAKVHLTEIYWSPIAVCTVKYNTGTDLVPGVVRMKNVLPQSFEIRISNPSGSSSEAELRDVHCVVVEQGSWEMPDRRKIEAHKYLSTKTDFGNQPGSYGGYERALEVGRASSWSGERRPYTNSYDEAPIVLGQVMTYNDPKWCVFWCRGSGDFTNPPDKEYLYTGKHVGQDSDVEHGDETVGYIVIEEGHLLSDGIEIETGSIGNIYQGYVEASTTHYFDSPFTTTQQSPTAPYSTPPEVAVLSQSTQRGENGAWAVLSELDLPHYMRVAVDEDQKFSTERNQYPSSGPDRVDYIAFARAGVVQLFPPRWVDCH
jgi:hypothetical protein